MHVIDYEIAIILCKTAESNHVDDAIQYIHLYVASY